MKASTVVSRVAAFILGAILLVTLTACGQLQPQSPRPADQEPGGTGAKVSGEATPTASGPLFKIEQGGKWGFIDKTGTVVINPKFDNTAGFSEDMAAVLIDNKGGYIDKSGAVVIPARFDVAENFHDGMARVELNDKSGYIDKTGKTVVRPQFTGAEKFGDGLAEVYMQGKLGYVDTTGAPVWEPTQ